VTTRRPIRILIVSDDDDWAGRVLARAALRGMTLSRAASTDDLDLAVLGHGANVVVLDTDVAPRRRARAATAFASAHPDVAVMLATTSPASARLAGLPLVGKTSADAVLQAAGRVGNGHGR
jgi:DNA-binding NtrC family response regulator